MCWEETIVRSSNIFFSFHLLFLIDYVHFFPKLRTAGLFALDGLVLCLYDSICSFVYELSISLLLFGSVMNLFFSEDLLKTVCSFSCFGSFTNFVPSEV